MIPIQFIFNRPQRKRWFSTVYLRISGPPRRYDSFWRKWWISIIFGESWKTSVIQSTGWLYQQLFMRMKSLSHSYRSVKSYPTIIMTLFTTPDKSGNIHSSLQGGGSHGKRVFQFPNPNFDAWQSCSFIFTIKVSIWGYPMISPIFKQAHHVPIKLTQRPLPPRLLHGCLQNLRTPKRKRKQLQHQAVLEPTWRAGGHPNLENEPNGVIQGTSWPKTIENSDSYMFISFHHDPFNRSPVFSW